MRLDIEHYQKELQQQLTLLDIQKVKELAHKITSVTERGGTLFVAGNGGSAATASHMVCDIQKTVLGHAPTTVDKSRCRVICLSDNIPLLTAWANDAAYEHVFSQPLYNLANKNDCLLVITGSGNSTNILEALSAAKEIGVESYALLGFDGGKAKDLADEYLRIDHQHYGIVEDMHMIIVHMLTDLLKHHE